MLTTTSGSKRELFYFGVRSSRCEPEQDINYMSSSKLVESMLLCGITFRKDILFTYETRELAEQGEQELFKEFECVPTMNCINLQSASFPYTPEHAASKILFFKCMIPVWDSNKRINDPRRLLTVNDVIYRTHDYDRIMHFNNHPEFLKEYYPSTGTKTYWYGREDKLMSAKLRGSKKYYTTDWSNVVGTPHEQIEILMRDHYVDGQRMAVLQEIKRLNPLIDKQFTLSLLSQYPFAKDHEFMYKWFEIFGKKRQYV